MKKLYFFPDEVPYDNVNFGGIEKSDQNLYENVDKSGKTKTQKPPEVNHCSTIVSLRVAVCRDSTPKYDFHIQSLSERWTLQ